MDFGAVLSRAWQIIWKHKVLWIFGILASCSGGSNYGTNFRSSYQRDLTPEMQNFFNQIPQWEIWLLVAIVVAVILVLVVLAIFLGTVGRIGLIRGTQEAEGGRTTLIFSDLFNGSLPYFWRVFGLNLLAGLAVFIIFSIVIVVGIFGAVITFGLGVLCLIPLICLMVPLGWLIGVVIEQANIAIVLEDLGIVQGVERGWDVFKKNLGAMIVMALILLVISLLAGFLIGLPLVAIVGPVFIAMVSGSQGVAQGGFLLAGLCLVAWIPVAIVLNGVLQSYVKTAWTLTYMRLTGKPAEAAASQIPEVV
jgi:small-conductance mechanosensitive channel